MWRHSNETVNIEDGGRKKIIKTSNDMNENWSTPSVILKQTADHRSIPFTRRLALVYVYTHSFQGFNKSEFKMLICPTSNYLRMSIRSLWEVSRMFLIMDMKSLSYLRNRVHMVNCCKMILHWNGLPIKINACRFWGQWWRHDMSQSFSVFPTSLLWGDSTSYPEALRKGLVMQTCADFFVETRCSTNCPVIWWLSFDVTALTLKSCSVAACNTTVRSRYIAVFFLRITHERHPIARP